MSMRRPWGFQRFPTIPDSWTWRLTKTFAPEEIVMTPVFQVDTLFNKRGELLDHVPVGGFVLDFFVRCNTVWNGATQFLFWAETQSESGGLWRELFVGAIGVGTLKYRLAGYRLPDFDRLRFQFEWESGIHECDAVHIYITFRTR
jgi:hypothetical protein